jgi:ribonuclease HI
MSDRIFIPSCSCCGTPEDPKAITLYDHDAGLSYRSGLRYTSDDFDDEVTWIDNSEVFIRVDGACSNNGQPTARAAVAAYFGPQSEYNWQGALDEDEKQSSQCAELTGAIRALEIVRDQLEAREPDWLEVRTVVVVSDSEYVVAGISTRIVKWKRNGYKASYGRGQSIANKEKFMELDGLVTELADVHDVHVKFWRIDREYNKEADEMAGGALEMVMGGGRRRVVHSGAAFVARPDEG